ncbi:MAG: class I SAM-dependent methyltransferase [Gemmatimonadetes bacterium]|jgi:SAM-dependent methyltransferase|nr:class I SAM-dependent methyltransferase [Gemmatimonadota bacterium]
MTHSVRSHLRVDIDAYDETIRRFIPGYGAMLEAAARAVTDMSPGLVLDLGAGTGALAAAILADGTVRTVELLDVDTEMLGQARSRLAGFKWRARFKERSFYDPLPSCDAVAASLSLHHVPTLADKRALYGRIHDTLWAGGVFVNADATMPAEPDARGAAYLAWADHMGESGIERERAFAHFAEWADEDTYFPLEDELAVMQAAGFEAECVWREGHMVVLVGRKR